MKKLQTNKWNLLAFITLKTNIPTADREDFFTGDYVVRLNSAPALGAVVQISQTNAYPLTILGLGLRGNTND